MKNNYGKRIFWGLLGMVLWGMGWAQNVNYQIYTVRYYTGYGNTDVWTDDDPRWWATFYDNTDGYVSGSYIIQGIDDGLDGPDWYNPTDELVRSRTNTSATGIRVSLESWEDDGGDGLAYDGGDDNHCGPSLSGVVSFRNDPICTWNTYTYSCSANWRVEYRVYWEWAGAPGITTQPNPTDRNVCVGTGTTLTVVADASARFYQWQVATGTSCTGASGWTNVSSGTGGTTASYTPPQTPGTRVYRCLISSNCTADFNSKTTTSSCVRVNYFPYAPAIQSGVCGSSTTLGSTQPFSVLLPPSVGAIANASYTWSVSPAGPTISAPTSSSTNITFPSSGSYTITLSTDDNGGPCNSVPSTCVVSVSAPDCDFIYVDPSTANTAVGSSNSPVNLTAAMGLISSTRNHVRIIGGTFNSLPTITIPTTVTASNITLEGGYVNTGGVWTKSSSSATVLNFTGTETISNDVAHVIGIKAVNTSGLTLQDLTITTAAASGQTTSGNGKSNYAVYLNNSSNWLITRCNITSGVATTGSNGVSGATGNPGGGGNEGGTGGCGGGNSTGGGGGNGGGGGAGATGGPGGDGAAGSAGGYGGGGGNDNGSTTSTTTISQSPGNWNGYKGAVGAGASGGASGNGGGWSSDGSCGNNSGQGSNGSAATAAGTVGSAGSTVAAVHSTGFYTPSYGNHGSGGNGGSGGGGGGGGGGDDDGIDVAGNGGNGGGGGGGGGEGGTGARGGGASFGVYVFANGTGSTVENTVINTGAAGTGGTGGSGGSGGAAGAGNTTQSCGCGDGNRGGAGGNGSAGGNGGKGGDGTTGLRYAIANAASTGITSTNSPTSASITVNSSVSGGSVPNPTNALAVNYNNTKGCTNSYITLDKNAGTWSNYGTGGDEVFDITSSLQSNTTASDPVSVFYTSTGWKDISTTTDTRARLLYVGTSRTPPVILGATSPLCMDGTLNLSCTPNSPSTVVGYEWTIQQTAVTGLTTPTPVFTSNAAAPSVSLSNATAADISYQIKLRVQDQCCGWSIPVYATVTVRPALTAGTISGTQSICYSGDPALLGNTTSAGNTLGTITYQWYYQENCVGPWTAIASSNAATYDPPTGLTNTRCYYREVQNCSQTEESNTIQVTVFPDFDPGSIATVGDTLCEPADPALIPVSITAAGGAGTYTYQWYYKNGVNACPSGTSTTGWTLISGASGNSYDPPSGLTTSRTYALQVDATGTPDCGAARWAGGCHQVTINPAPLPFTPTLVTATPLCYRGNALVNVASSESGITYQLRDNTTSVGSSQAGSGSTLAFHTANLTATNGNYNVLASTGLGCTLSVAVPSISVTAAPSALAMNTDTRTCYVNGNNAYVEFISANGSILAINPGAQNLGNVSVTEYVNGTPLGVQACGTWVATQPQFNTATLQRHWTISSTVAPTGNLNVRLYFSDADIAALSAASLANVNLWDNLTSASDLELSKYSGTNENGLFTDNCGNGTVTLHPLVGTGAMSMGNIGYTVNSSGYTIHTVSSFSELWLSGISNVSPLPIELTSFTAECQQGRVYLNWETASEINNERFVLERSVEMLTWETVAEQPGAGNSNAPRMYEAIDERPLPGLSYYRLTQKDYDGHSETFTPVGITCYTDGKGNAFMVYPNPADDKFTVKVTLEEATQGELELTEMNGKSLFTRNLQLNSGSTEFTFDRAGLMPGTYLIRLKTDKAELTPLKLILK